MQKRRIYENHTHHASEKWSGGRNIDGKNMGIGHGFSAAVRGHERPKHWSADL